MAAMEPSSALALLGGFFIGTYPIFVKTPTVLAAKAHPAVFQLYKSLLVALTGTVLVLCRWARGEKPAFAFCWFSVISACVWVPAGTCLVAAVPRAGVGASLLLFDGTTTLLSFVAFTVCFGEQMRPHARTGGGAYYMAPLYLATALVGMASLVFLPKWVASHRAAAVSDTKAEPLLVSGRQNGSSQSSQLLGYAFAMAAGALSAVQYGLVTAAKQHAVGLEGDPTHKESLDPLGSWTASFGISALIINTGGILVLRAVHAARGLAPPALLIRQIWLPASAAGLCYSSSIIATTLAVELGGNAVTLAQRNAMSLVTGGAWGMLWYREQRGFAALAWCASAALTMGSVVMLGLEKGAG